jgi:hypothetical protein
MSTIVEHDDLELDDDIFSGFFKYSETNEPDRFKWSHCSNHVNWMNGCSDCDRIHLLSNDDDDPDHFVKTDNTGTHPLEIRVADPNPRFQLIRQQLARVFAVFFAKAKKKAVAAALNKTREFVKFGKTQQLSDEQRRLIILAAYAAIQWQELVSGVTTDLYAAAQSGAAEGLMQAGDTSENSLTKVNEFAQKYARNRAAEMIGKKYEEDELVANSNAKFIISDTTKDDLRDVMEQSFAKEETLTELQERILTAGTFSDLRSQLIAKTEVALAQTSNHLNAWKETGVVTKVGIRLSDSHTVYDECDEIAEEIYKIENCPLIPVHPNCRCTIYAIDNSEK